MCSPAAPVNLRMQAVSMKRSGKDEPLLVHPPLKILVPIGLARGCGKSDVQPQIEQWR
jgi:hypothetical protein